MTSTAVDVGAAGDFEPGVLKRVEAGGRALVVVRDGERVFALRDTCSHKGARLSEGVLTGTALPCKPGEEIRYGRRGEILRCPWHGWEFDLATGRSLTDPGRERVRSYPAFLRHGRVFVEI